MCYHKSQDAPKETLETRYNAKFESEEAYKHYHHVGGFGHPSFSVLTNENPTRITTLSWGLIPFWVKDTTTAKKMAVNCLNAIGEEIFDKPAFRDSIKSRRCIIPVTGFYEWRHVGKEKYPYHISVHSTSIFSLAGTWSIWTNPETGEEKRTYSVLTTAANPLMSKIHNSKMRMPLILSKEDERLWLEDLKKEDIKQLIKPYPADDMKAHTISKLITDRNSNSNCVQVKEEFQYLGLEAI